MSVRVKSGASQNLNFGGCDMDLQIRTQPVLHAVDEQLSAPNAIHVHVSLQAPRR